MKLAFYYHIEFAYHEGCIYLPSVLGVFLDDLSKRVETLDIIAHMTSYNPRIQDYKLEGRNINLIEIGKKTNSLYRLYRGSKELSYAVENTNADILLVRAPSPLAPWLYYKFNKKMKVKFLIVGDYASLPSKLFSASRILYKSYEFIMNKFIMPKCSVLVNSRSLYDKYNKVCKNVYEVRTTTLNETDFFIREDVCQGETIHLLYVGRFDWGKGIKELFQAIAKLKEENYNIMLHLVGWDETKGERIRKEMHNMISSFGIENYVIDEGRKKIGSDLNEVYNASDIFVLPSYSEGMPRCIWEAMAHGLPVVATKVGGIPFNLKEDEAMLINHHDVDALVHAIKELISSLELRISLIKKGYLKAQEVTLSKCNENILSCL